METVLDPFSIDESGLMLYDPKQSQALPKFRVFADFARERMRPDFGLSDDLPTMHRPEPADGVRPAA